MLDTVKVKVRVGENHFEAEGNAGAISTDFRKFLGALQEVEFRLPITTSKIASLRVPTPLTEKEWQQMLRVIRKMKPGIVDPTPAAGEEG
jgi:hypothetical protein